MKENRISSLDEIITEMQKKFPRFVYCNSLKKKGNRYNLGNDAYAIVIEKIRNEEVSSFLKFVDDEILLPLIEKGIELPLVITL